MTGLQVCGAFLLVILLLAAIACAILGVQLWRETK